MDNHIFHSIKLIKYEVGLIQQNLILFTLKKISQQN